MDHVHYHTSTILLEVCFKTFFIHAETGSKLLHISVLCLNLDISDMGYAFIHEYVLNMEKRKAFFLLLVTPIAFAF